MTGLNIGPWASGFGPGPSEIGVGAGPWSSGYGPQSTAVPELFGNAPAQPSGWGSENLASAGMILAAFGAVNSAIGGYFSAKSQRWQLKSQAKTLEFQKMMSELNARMAEDEATDIQQTGQAQASQYSMRAGAARSALRASMAARGIDESVGSAAEAFTTMEYAKKSDMATINANAFRAAEAQRIQALNYRTQAAMQGVSAQNVWASRKTISPDLELAGSLLGSAGSIGGAYLNYRGVQMRRR